VTRTVRRNLSLDAAFGACFVLWGVIAGLRPFGDNSFITHLATGRLILGGDFPRSDPYSFTAEGTTWVVQSWLASVAYAGIERLGGSNAIHLLTALAAGLLALLIWTLTRPAQQMIPRIAVAGAAMVVGVNAWSERPLLFGLLGVAVVLLALEGRLHPGWLIPLFWCWANLHGSYPLGLAAAATFAVGTRLDGDDARTELRVLAAGAIGVAVSVIGPLGLQVLTFPVALLGRSDVLADVIEWQSPSFTSAWSRIFLLQVVVGVLGLVRRGSYRHAIPFVVFVAAALLGTRNIAVASLVLTPILAGCWGGLGSLRGDRRTPVASALVAAVVLVGALAVQVRLQEPGWDWGLYPMHALGYAQQEDLLGRPEVRVLTTDYTGNFLIGVHGTDANVFMDDRFDMYPREVIDDFRMVVRAGADWVEVLDRWEIDAVVWHRDGAVATLITTSPDWRVAYQDEESLVACRSSVATCGPAEDSVTSGLAQPSRGSRPAE
jgi:hypothetical protein